MKEKKKNTAGYHRVSQSFKISIVVLLFLLTAIRLALIYYFPSIEIISDKVFLFIVLAIIFYLWVQELIDFHHLITINKELEEAHEQLKEAEIDTIASLIKTEEAKDLYTRGHSERVTSIALAIAGEMKVGEGTKRILARAGVLHDIGKISINDAVLHKKEKLTDEDWSVIRSHPEIAIKILEPLKFLETERDIILCHHERYDGKGYPNGYKGEQISQEAMILAVADAFDAMNSKRPYREPLTQEAILEELKKGRGTQFAPQIVDVFLTLLDKDPQLWRKVYI